MNILRIFPRRTRATPDDPLAIVGENNIGPLIGMLDDIDEVHISVTWTYDLPMAERIFMAWSNHGVKVLMSGPACNDPGGEFVPGRYLKPGYTITSRGCPNRCWFCDVWKREGDIRELEIKDGYNVLDSNLLACSDDHVRAVFAMLQRQPQRAEFTGGLEAAILKPWHCAQLKKIRTKRMFFAYDTPDDLEPLIQAGRMLVDAGFTTASHALRCYVLMGYKGDTIPAAERRVDQTIKAGFFPMAMVYRDRTGYRSPDWIHAGREMAQPFLVGRRIKKVKRGPQTMPTIFDNIDSHLIQGLKDTDCDSKKERR